MDVYRYFDVENLATYNLISFIGALALIGGIVASLANLYLSVHRGVRAGATPGAARRSSSSPRRLRRQLRRRARRPQRRAAARHSATPSGAARHPPREQG